MVRFVLLLGVLNIDLKVKWLKKSGTSIKVINYLKKKVILT